MSVSVSMPQLGESVTEGTVTRWLKREGDHVSADEPLLEVSTDKVDTEIPSPVSGVLRGISVAEDETVAVGAELAVIDEDGSAGGSPSAATGQPAAFPPSAYAEPAVHETPHGGEPAGIYAPPAPSGLAQPGVYEPPAPGEPAQPAAYQQAAAEPAVSQPPGYAGPPAHEPPVYLEPYQPTGPPGYAEPSGYAEPAAYQPTAPPEPPAYAEPAAYHEPAYAEPAGSAPPQAYAAPPAEEGTAVPGAPPGPAALGGESPYVTPLVRKLAAEHGIDLGTISGTGVGGRIRKQDVLDAARSHRDGEVERHAAGPVGPGPQAPSARGPAAPPAVPAATAGQSAAAPGPGPAPTLQSVTPSSHRGTTERLSRARLVIAQRMVESLQTSAQLTTVVEADVTAVARLRDRARAAFEAREGVKLSFLPFFALAAVEALKIHPKVNAVVDVAAGTVTYHDAEHLGIAVDTDRGLMVPVIRNAGDLNIGGLARKIADLAQRTRAGQVSPDDLSGGTFTLTNTGSRGALFDTPIINMPQVGILGTGTVNRRAVVVDEPALGEVITVRSMVYLALTYDHRLVDGADAARFLVTIKNRLEEGGFEAELGL